MVFVFVFFFITPCDIILGSSPKRNLNTYEHAGSKSSLIVVQFLPVHKIWTNMSYTFKTLQRGFYSATYEMSYCGLILAHSTVVKI